MIKRYFEVLEPMEPGFKLNPTGKWKIVITNGEVDLYIQHKRLLFKE